MSWLPKIAERIGRSKEDEPANAVGMTRGEHHCDGAAVRMAGNIGLVEAESVHEGGEAVGCGLEPRVQPGNPLGLAHVEEIDGVHAGIAGKKADVLAPVLRGADQAVEQQQRTPSAGALVVDLCPVDQDKGLFNLGKSFCHCRSRLKSVSDVDVASKRFRWLLRPVAYVTGMLILVKSLVRFCKFAACDVKTLTMEMRMSDLLFTRNTYVNEIRKISPNTIM